MIGRSIGTGIALELVKAQQKKEEEVVKIYRMKPRALALISPFASVKDLAKQHVGKIGTFLAKEQYNNLENIEGVECPVFIVHGQQDSLIACVHSKELLGIFLLLLREMPNSQSPNNSPLNDSLILRLLLRLGRPAEIIFIRGRC